MKKLLNYFLAGESAKVYALKLELIALDKLIADYEENK